MDEFKENAVTTSAICDFLECSIAHFYAKHKKNLTPIGKEGRTVLYEKESVRTYGDSVKKISNNYNITETWIDKI
jgi:hypothetical protein